MKKQDKIRIATSISFIVLGIIGYFTGIKTGEELYCIPIFLFALYPLSKIGYEDRFNL